MIEEDHQATVIIWYMYIYTVLLKNKFLNPDEKWELNLWGLIDYWSSWSSDVLHVLIIPGNKHVPKSILQSFIKIIVFSMLSESNKVILWFFYMQVFAVCLVLSLTYYRYCTLHVHVYNYVHVHGHCKTWGS